MIANQQQVVQVVPRLSPPVTGVGDYALCLADELRRSHGIVTRFVVGDPDWSGPERVNEFRVVRVAARTAPELAKLLACEAADRLSVFIHYVGYGYEKRGCPVWLVRGLEQWRNAATHRRLLTMFHELYARGPIWSSSFWNAPLQQWLVARLARISDGCRTSMRSYADWLAIRAARHQGSIPVFPVFSTVGELEQLPRLESRPPHLAIFGGGKWCADAFTVHRGALERACQILQIEKIITIGSPVAIPAKLSVPAQDLGILPAAEVRHCLANVRVGLLNYFSGYLGKSSIYAAYSAHGLLPLFGVPNHSELEGLHAGAHYLVAPELPPACSVSAMQGIADQARQWYSGHSIAQTGLSVARQLRENLAP